MSKIIFVDVDDTLAATREAFVEYYRLFTGDFSTDATMPTGPKYDELCPLWDRARLTHTFMDPVFFSLLKPIEGAREAMTYLVSKGYDVRICTAHRQEGRAMKYVWIRQHFPMVPNIIMTEPFVPKDDYYGYAFIDDHVYNLQNNKSEVKVLFDNWQIIDYNNNDVKKIINWEQIKEVL